MDLKPYLRVRNVAINLDMVRKVMPSALNSSQSPGVNVVSPCFVKMGPFLGKKLKWLGLKVARGCTKLSKSVCTISYGFTARPNRIARLSLTNKSTTQPTSYVKGCYFTRFAHDLTSSIRPSYVLERRFDVNYDPAPLKPTQVTTVALALYTTGREGVLCINPPFIQDQSAKHVTWQLS